MISFQLLLRFSCKFKYRLSAVVVRGVTVS